VLHLDGPKSPRLPERRLGALGQIAASAFVHVAVALTCVVALGRVGTSTLDPGHPDAFDGQPCIDVSHVVFVAAALPPGSGGGGGGNRRDAPVRRAESAGADAITLRTSPRDAVTTATPARSNDVEPLPAILVDAVPLAAGTSEQIGLPSTGAPVSMSTGPGSGGGVGTGTGAGIGSGQGRGLGPGSGGGTGGGAFRAGGAVTAPRLLSEVRPSYTSIALLRRLQGTVELEVVVTRDGRPSQIRIVRSLDPGGLDDEAVKAVREWRFEPGRYAGAPVDVLVTILVDFWIR